jgi:hypothetical protein
MRGRGVLAVSGVGLARLALTVWSLSLILAWPVTGAGQGGGGHLGAMSLAVRVEASATIVVGARLGGTFR